VNAQGFLDSIFGDAVGPNARIVVFTLPDRRSESFDTSEQATNYAVGRADDSDVYFGCGLYLPGSAGGRGTAADVAGITSVWADIDFGPGHKKRVPPDEASALRILDSVGIKPSIVVHSGHGLHAYWLLSEFTSADDGAAGLARRWCGHVRAVAGALGYELDSVGDLSRVLRVPGTMNRKGEPAPVRLVTDLDHEPTRHHADDLLDLCGTESEPNKTPQSVVVAGLRLDPKAEPPAKLAILCENDEKFRKTWEHDRPGLTDSSPSGYDCSLASQAVRCGWSDQEIADTLTAFRKRHNLDPAKALRLDYIQTTITKARAGANGSHVANAEPKDPPALIPPWVLFPIELLPEPLASFVEETSAALGCDLAFVGLPALAVVASCIGTTRVVRLKKTWTEPPILWAAVVARSGTLKSPALDAAVKPLRDAQAARFAEFEVALAGHEEAKIWYDRRLKEWGKKKESGLPEKPEPPHCVRYAVSDCTLEALAPILLTNPRGVLLVRDELAAWLHGFDRYKTVAGSDAPCWLEFHRGGSVTIDRKTGDKKLIHVPRAAVSVCGTIQPKILANALTAEFYDCGLAARLLLANPPERVKQWSTRRVSAATSGAYERLIETLLALEHDAGEHGPRPIELSFAPDALAVWAPWYNQHALRIHNAATDREAAMLAKLEAAAARFALIFTLAENPQAATVTADATRNGTDLADWFAGEAERVYAVLGESVEDRERRQNLERVGKAGGSVSVREWQRCRSHKSAAGAEAELEGFVRAGFGSWEMTQPGEAGGRPGKQFVLSYAADTDKTQSHDSATSGFVSVNSVRVGVTKPEAPPPTTPAAADDPTADALADLIDGGGFELGDDDGGGDDVTALARV